MSMLWKRKLNVGRASGRRRWSLKSFKAKQRLLRPVGPSTCHLPRSKKWVDEAKRGMENALRAKPLDVREQYERQIKELQEAYGEAMLELRARKKLASLLGEEDK